MTKAIFEFVKPLAAAAGLHRASDAAAAALVQALFFARWCNRDTTLKALDPSLLSDPAALKRQLTSAAAFPPPWCNETAYPVEPVAWEGATYSRLDAATGLFHDIRPWLLRSIRDQC